MGFFKRQLKNWILTLSGYFYSKLFARASRNVKKAQGNVLRSFIKENASTEYGRVFAFNEIKSLKDYQRLVPLNTYDELEPWIQRQKEGNKNVLMPGSPDFYVTTSGTTGQPKFIPMSKRYMESCHRYYSRINFYWDFRDNPGCTEGTLIAMVGKPVEGNVEDGTPYGTASGRIYAERPSFLTEGDLPVEVYGIENYQAKYYVVMRLALEKKISFFIAPNPSTFGQVAKILHTYFDDLVQDLKKGKISHKICLNKDLREKLERKLLPQVERAKELEELRRNKSFLTFKDLWPQLQLVQCWKSGNSALYLQQIHQYLGENVVVREFGYMASEFHGGLVAHNDSTGTILSCDRILYEFIPLEETQGSKVRPLLAHEIEQGKQYEIVISNGSGLYRYRMNDIVYVEGFYNEFPIVRFVQKGAGVTSLTGEKLYEQQLINAVQSAQEALNMPLKFFVAFADLSLSSYRLFIEPVNEMSLQERKEFAGLVDQMLMHNNMEYAAKRESRRLQPLLIHLLQENAFDKYKEYCLDNGMRECQFKLVHLMQDDVKMKIFIRLVATAVEYKAVLQ